MDWSNVIIGVLALIGTLYGSYISNSKSTALIAYRIKELEDKVNKHNHLVERMAVVERDMKTAFNKIDEVKDDIHELKEK